MRVNYKDFCNNEIKISICNCLDDENIQPLECFECGCEININDIEQKYILFCDDDCREIFFQKYQNKSIDMMNAIYDLKQIEYNIKPEFIKDFLTGERI
jgi:hypothetical protein